MIYFFFIYDFYHPDEIIQRGYLNAVVEIEASKYFEVVFYTFNEINFAKKNGASYFTEAGIIILSELKKELMLKSLQELYTNSMYFNELKEHPKEKYIDYKEAEF